MHLRWNRNSKVLQLLPIVDLSNYRHKSFIVVTLQLATSISLHDRVVFGSNLVLWSIGCLINRVFGEDWFLHTGLEMVVLTVLFNLVFPLFVLLAHQPFELIMPAIVLVISLLTLSKHRFIGNESKLLQYLLLSFNSSDQ